MKEKTVPVMIDDLKEIGNFRMTRATYFYVESLEPSPDILLEFGELEFPVFSLEFSGVIYRPLGDTEIFESSDLIENIFLEVEKHESFYVDSDNLWIPNRMFDRRPARGDVYRLNYSLFSKLYTLCKDDASLDDRARKLVAPSGDIAFSEKETEAFKDWTNSIIEEAKRVYPKDRNLKLVWE
jgi:hypothetical protein